MNSIIKETKHTWICNHNDLGKKYSSKICIICTDLQNIAWQCKKCLKVNLNTLSVCSTCHTDKLVWECYCRKPKSVIYVKKHQNCICCAKSEAMSSRSRK